MGWERKNESLGKKERRDKKESEGGREGEGDIASLASHGMAAGCWLAAAKDRNTVAPTLNINAHTFHLLTLGFSVVRIKLARG